VRRACGGAPGTQTNKRNTSKETLAPQPPPPFSGSAPHLGADRVATLVERVGPHLRREEELLSRHSAGSDGLTDGGLVAVKLGAVQETIAQLQCRLDASGYSRALRRQLQLQLQLGAGAGAGRPCVMSSSVGPLPSPWRRRLGPLPRRLLSSRSQG
jgi:hypothetical protein